MVASWTTLADGPGRTCPRSWTRSLRTWRTYQRSRRDRGAGRAVHGHRLRASAQPRPHQCRLPHREAGTLPALLLVAQEPVVQALVDGDAERVHVVVPFRPVAER